MIAQYGDKHHIFPKNFLKKNKKIECDYNQIANLAYMQTEINKSIRDRPPKEYLTDVIRQCEDGILRYGNIIDRGKLNVNLEQNCIPQKIVEMGIADYDRFLDARRVLIAQKIKRYYFSLQDALTQKAPK